MHFFGKTAVLKHAFNFQNVSMNKKKQNKKNKKTRSLVLTFDRLLAFLQMEENTIQAPHLVKMCSNQTNAPSLADGLIDDVQPAD